MALSRLGLNLSNLNNITSPPNFNIANNSLDLVNDVPQKANEITKGYYGFAVLTALFFFLLYKLHQSLYNGGDYGFSLMRSIGLSSAICSVLGIYCLSMGYFVNYYHVAIFIISAFVFTAVVWKMQR